MNILDIEYYSKTTRPKTLIVTPEDGKNVTGLLLLEGARKRVGSVAFAPNPFLVPRIRDILGTLVPTERAALWWTEEKQRHRVATAFATQTDATLASPQASRLWPYQRTGVSFLATRKRAILGDDCGLGKTVEALVAASEVGARSVLVVTLASVKRQWQEEMREWLGVDAVVVDGTVEERQTLVRAHPTHMIIHYDILRAAFPYGTKKAQYPELLRFRYDVVILDESQRLQNAGSGQSKAARKLVTQAQHVFQLTGTPMWNMPDSLWHLLHLLDKDVFSSYWAFVTRYCTVRETVYGKVVEGLRQDALVELRNVLAHYMLRREKHEVRHDLPAKLYSTLWYDLTPEQQQVYSAITREARLPGKSKVYANVASMLPDLRFLCDAPQLLGYSFTSPKETLLLELLERLFQEKERKVVVFCWHKRYVEYLRALLTKKHYRVLIATGNNEARDRDEIVRTQFKDGDAQVLLGTIGAIGTAYNIAFSDTAIFMEMDWTPANNRQGEDRLHRFTTTHQVTIYRILCRTGIEKHILDVHREKSDLANEMLAKQEVVRRIETERP